MNSTGNTAFLDIENQGFNIVKLTQLLVSTWWTDDHGSPRFHCSDEDNSTTGKVFNCVNTFRRMTTATECTLRWCIKTYSASMESGLFLETNINSSTDYWWNKSASEELTKDLVPTSYYQTAPRSPMKETANQSRRLPSYHDIEDTSYAAIPGLKYDPCYVGFSSHNFLSSWLASFLTISFSLPSGLQGGIYRPDVATLLTGWTVYSSHNASVEAIDNAPGKYDRELVPQIFANIAAGLTQIIRWDSHAWSGENGNATIEVWD
ncbi:MAG: hypothetical protein Q9226_008481, partial [Calogaya cf. arnoldii]